MRQLASTFLFQLLAISTFAQWTNLGLNGLQVNDLTVYSDTIYASTDDGLYKKSKLTTDSIWTSCGMQGNHIAQTLVENHQTFISVVTLDGEDTNAIYKSENGGLTFSSLTSGVPNTYLYLYLDHMAHPPGDFNTLYLLDHLLKSDDGGTNWDPLNFDINNNRFIMVNPTNPAQLIVGGEGDFFNALLQVSNDYGSTWEYPSMNAFFNGDNCIHDLAIDDSLWYAAGEGIIAKTIDGGENWEQILNLFNDETLFSLYYTNIEFSPITKDILYVSGLNNTNTNEVPLLISDNRGADWDTLYFNSPVINQKVKCLTVDNIENSDYIFLGGKGVYLYKRTVTGVVDNKANLSLTIYPNPTTDRLNITYTSSSNGPLTFNIFDLHGRLISQQQLNPSMGEQTFSIDISTLSKGTYVLQLVDGKRTGSSEFVVQ